jgi:hypothetical protein
MKRELVAAAGWAVAFLAVALALRFARELGYIEQDTATRVISVAIGLYIVWYGNRLPKDFVPSITGRRVRRVAGWSQVVSGLVYTGLWAFAPIPVAVKGGAAAIVAGIAVTIAYCLSLRSKAKAKAA